MASFENITVTKAGRQLMAYSLSNEISIKFTRMQIGDGEAPPFPEELGDLVNGRFNITITRVGLSQPDVAMLRGVFKPTGLLEDFKLKEIGVYAETEETEEILFAYAHAGENYDLIPKSSSTTLMEEVFILSIMMGGAQVLIQDFDPHAVATIEDIDEKIKQLDIEGLREEIESLLKRLAELNEQLGQAELGFVSKGPQGDVMEGDLTVPNVIGHLQGSADQWNGWQIFHNLAELSRISQTTLESGSSSMDEIVAAMPALSRLVCYMDAPGEAFPMGGKYKGILEIQKQEGNTAKALYSTPEGNSWRGIYSGNVFSDWWGAMDVPAGTVVAHAGKDPDNIPVGYLLANGYPVSRKEYSALYDAIGDMYGEGDGETTFNLPDLRGYFIRGLDAGRGIDSGRQQGSIQEDAIRRIFGTVSNFVSTGLVSSGVLKAVSQVTEAGSLNSYASPNGVHINRLDLDTAINSANTASEIRPKNIALMYLIKY